MFILEITLKGTPAGLTVQKKEEADATAAYQQVVTSMQSAGTNQLLELACDHQTGKKVSVFASEICAVQVYEKTAGGTSGRTPGFFSMAE
ncbi:hypothetical protein IQ266_24870 [filamentous cyanobacterium LEGE 11480]|uniref:Uncharacterized protein n=1 Tax=Romeriopsis navalis LEGE 11480 TaxID=2777977 RepID=A0A928Z5M4_9CYAN|nr:hypothetical protein [Romeriopsis navalis]MBE9032974.1 hypothetical protein [Romeriopsis navalis LEGE 11480]